MKTEMTNEEKLDSILKSKSKNLLKTTTFSNLTLNNKSYESSKIRDIVFNNCIFDQIIFDNCEFDNCEFVNSHFSIIEFSKCEITNCKFTNGHIKDFFLSKSHLSSSVFIGIELNKVEFFQTNFKNNQFEDIIASNVNSIDSDYDKMTIKNSFFNRSFFKKNIWLNIDLLNVSWEKTHFIRSSFKENSFENNQFKKCWLIKCKGYNEEVFDSSILKGEIKTKYFYQKLVKSKIAITFLVLLLLFCVYFGSNLIYGSRYLYLRYVVEMTWKDPNRQDLGFEIDALKYFFNQANPDFTSNLNRAIQAKKDKKKHISKNFFFECLKDLEGVEENKTAVLWVLNEILILCKKENEWEKYFLFVESKYSKSLLQDIRIAQITSFRHNKYFPKIALKNLELFLLDVDDDYERLSAVVNYVNRLPFFYGDLKKDMGLVCRSFLSRKISNNKNSLRLKVLRDNLETWLINMVDSS